MIHKFNQLNLLRFTKNEVNVLVQPRNRPYMTEKLLTGTKSKINNKDQGPVVPG